MFKTVGGGNMSLVGIAYMYYHTKRYWLRQHSLSGWTTGWHFTFLVHSVAIVVSCKR